MPETLIDAVKLILEERHVPAIVRDKDCHILYATPEADHMLGVKLAGSDCFRVMHGMSQRPDACPCGNGLKEAKISKFYEPTHRKVFEHIHIPIGAADNGGASMDILRVVDTVPQFVIALPRGPHPPVLLDDTSIIPSATDVAIVSLTAKERDVLKHIMDGKPTQDIGEQMGISANTVNFHMKNLFGKLGAENRTHAAAIGYSHTLRKTNLMLSEMQHRVKRTTLPYSLA